VTVFSLPNDTFFSNYWLSAILIDPAKTAGITREIVRLKLDKSNIESSAMETDAFATCFLDILIMVILLPRHFFNGLCLPSGSKSY
jgi:hypothetical protein